MKKFIFSFYLATALCGGVFAQNGEAFADENSQPTGENFPASNLGEIAEQKLILDEQNLAQNEPSSDNALQGIFFGVDAGLMSVQPKYSLSTGGQQGTQKDSFTADTLLGRLAGEFGVKIGLNFSENHRIYLRYAYQTRTKANGVTMHKFGSVGNQFAVNTEAKTDAHKLVFGYDFLLETFKENRAFAGLYLGWARLNTKAKSTTYIISAANLTHYELETTPNTGNFNFDAFIIGLNAGHIFKLYKGNELEIGVRAEYLHSSTEKSSVSSVLIVNNTSRDFGTSTIKHNSSSINAGIYAAYSFNLDF